MGAQHNHTIALFKGFFQYVEAFMGDPTGKKAVWPPKAPGGFYDARGIGTKGFPDQRFLLFRRQFGKTESNINFCDMAA